MYRRRLLGVTSGLLLSLAVAGTAFAHSCLNLDRAAPACHPNCEAPVFVGKWVWLPSIGVPVEHWGFDAPGESLLVNSAYCTKGVNTDREHGIVSGCE
jgi:hypothetical protein